MFHCDGNHPDLHSFPTRRSSDLVKAVNRGLEKLRGFNVQPSDLLPAPRIAGREPIPRFFLEYESKEQILSHLRCAERRSEEHTSELQSRVDLVCRLLLEKKKI